MSQCSPSSLCWALLIAILGSHSVLAMSASLTVGSMAGSYLASNVLTQVSAFGIMDRSAWFSQL